ncbi:hypothetical protein ACPV36_19555 [Photobacterium damselae]
MKANHKTAAIVGGTTVLVFGLMWFIHAQQPFGLDKTLGLND